AAQTMNFLTIYGVRDLMFEDVGWSTCCWARNEQERVPVSEAEWLSCSDPVRLLEVVRKAGRATLRRNRLFACGCCRRLGPLLTDERTRAGLEVAERFADRRVTCSERESAEDAAQVARRRVLGTEAPEAYDAATAVVMALSYDSADPAGVRVAVDTAGTAALAVYGAGSHDRQAEHRAQSDLVRDVFGNPFRPVVIDPSWVTLTAVSLARGIYDERAFDRLPILADALTDGGCSNDDLLDHLRGPGPHVCGCWALDLVLGKS
ncbi:MAG: hypothetical protein JWO38_7132, partial [Gemmataceae bacterium]|nr:hypothetical protein [Gemmataceae bacterium]